MCIYWTWRCFHCLCLACPILRTVFTAVECIVGRPYKIWTNAVTHSDGVGSLYRPVVLRLTETSAVFKTAINHSVWVLIEKVWQYVYSTLFRRLMFECFLYVINVDRIVRYYKSKPLVELKYFIVTIKVIWNSAQWMYVKWYLINHRNEYCCNLYYLFLS